MYEKITLPNGVRILTERMSGIRSAAIGVFVATGSREESASENGAAHFIEHMVFKGSETQSAALLAQRMDAVGGQVNAYTTKECTCFYAHVLDSHLHEALDILTELVFEAKFDQRDVETERGVILEEIGMYRDTPDDLVSEILMKKIYKGSALARPILGTAATLKNMTGDSLKAYQKAHYLPEKLIVSLAGSFDDSVVAELVDRFSRVEPGKTVKQKAAVYHPAIALKKKAIEQNHLILAFPSIPQASQKKYGMQLLSSMLGGGMSSRLFQEVREKQGLCYTVSSYGACYADTGVFCIYTALNKDMETQALETICQTVSAFTQAGVGQEELNRAREQSKANVLMGLESTSSRMHYLARCQLTGEPILSPDEIIAAYDKVTVEEIRTLAQETFDFRKAALSAVGRVADEAHYQELLAQF